MIAFYAVLKRWVKIQQICSTSIRKSANIKKGRSYLADLKLANVWKLNTRFVTQSTSASCCESNWSNCEYIFSKRRYCLANELAEKLVHIHGNLRNIENSKEIEKDTDIYNNIN